MLSRDLKDKQKLATSRGSIFCIKSMSKAQTNTEHEEARMERLVRVAYKDNGVYMGPKH